MQDPLTAFDRDHIEMMSLAQATGLHGLTVQRTTRADPCTLESVPKLVGAQEDFAQFPLLLDLFSVLLSRQKFPSHKDHKQNTDEGQRQSNGQKIQQAKPIQFFVAQ